MSLFGSMWTSVSGMNAQSMRINTVADNIANASTTGYKDASIEFESMLMDNTAHDYTSGAVFNDVRNNIAAQGAIQSTSSVTDLAIRGGGFFVATASDGTPFLTRAGSFVPDSSGNLVNAAGLTLMGEDLQNPSSAAPTMSNLVPIKIDSSSLIASPTTSGTFTANLPSTSTAITGALPSANSATSTYTAKSSITAYNNLGAPVTLDVYFSNTGSGNWEATVFDASTASTGGGFPYSSGPLATTTLSFSSTDGSLKTGSPMSISVPNGGTLSLDLSNTTQLASSYSVISQTLNGSAPSQLSNITIANDGTLSYVYQNGTSVAAYKVPLATCVSPDNLQSGDGNTFSQTSNSGPILIGNAGSGNLGSIYSSSLENSTVDLASQLTEMIAAQQSYTSNSKVFQTVSDLMQVLNNIK